MGWGEWATVIPGAPTGLHQRLGRPKLLSCPGPWLTADLSLRMALASGENGSAAWLRYFDGLGHPMVRITGREADGLPDGNYMYNGVRLEDVGTPYGIKELGVENVGSFFTRGILIDMVALRGGNLEKGYSITLDDNRQALERQGIGDAEQGNVVLVRTGWNDLWRDNQTKEQEQAVSDNVEFNSGEPGVSEELCDHLAERKVSMLGMDNWGIEPYDFSKTPPTVIPAWAYCHMNLTARRGIYLFENMDLETLGEERVYEFLFSWAPLNLVGATGSPGNPIAAY